MSRLLGFGVLATGLALAAVGARLAWEPDVPLADAGVTKQTCTVEGFAFSDAGNRYLAREVPCLGLPDGGFILPRWPMRRDNLPAFTVFSAELVTQDATGCDAGICDSDEDDAGTPRSLPRLLQCACRTTQPDAGVCRYRLADGGLALAPFGETLGPGYGKRGWVGLGCVRKACVELSGFPSMPSECE
jgi:hypothetical protein